MYVGNLDNQIVGGATNLDFSDLQESLNRIYNSMHQLFPGEVIEFKKMEYLIYSLIDKGIPYPKIFRFAHLNYFVGRLFILRVK